jgi:hypothetical protein
MRIHLVLIRNAAGALSVAYLGEDRAAALSTYESCGDAGDTIELYSYPELTRRRNVIDSQRRKKK